MQVIGTAGHVDHGKSTLVRRLTGIDPDRWDEEKRRGLTIDLGFAWLTLPSGREVGLIDVPGHERFIKNMLAGAGGITVCLFVVAANEGWMPQSAEHLAILDVLGVTHGVVAITKSDTVERDALDFVVEEVREKIGRSSLSNAPVVPVSAETGSGLEDLVDSLDEVVSSAPPAQDRGRPRLWVDRVFTIAGAGTVVTGTLTGGSFASGDLVELAPAGRKARVRGMQSHKRSLEHVTPGNRVALNLANLEREGAVRGDAVVPSGEWRSTHLIDASVRVLPSDIIGREHRMSSKGSHLLYVGSAETPARVRLLDRESVGPGEQALVQIHLRDPLPLERGDRFVLRDAGRVLTFGGGQVLDPLSTPVGKDKQGKLVLMKSLASAEPPEALAALLDAEGEIAIADTGFRTGFDGEDPPFAVIGDRYVSARRIAELESALSARLSQHHRDSPLEAGMRKETARSELGLSAKAFDDLLQVSDEIEERGQFVALKSFAVTLDPTQSRRRDELLERIDAGAFSPPLVSELDADQALIRSLVDSGALVKVNGFYLTADRATEARKRVRNEIRSRGPLSVAQIRDLLGTTRKYAVPLCEWLDATGATVRKEDVRLLGPRE